MILDISFYVIVRYISMTKIIFGLKNAETTLQDASTYCLFDIYHVYIHMNTFSLNLIYTTHFNILL